MISNRIERLQISGFDFFYMFVMFLYCAGMTAETQRMQGTLSGNPIPFLIPIFFTVIFISKHHVTFKSPWLTVVLITYTLWMLAISILKNQLEIKEFSFHFFSYYSILVAYIQVRVFGRKIFYIFEELITLFAIVSLFFWIPSAIIPGYLQSFFGSFPSAGYGHNFFYIYNSTDPILRAGAFFYQNSGCCNEPGRFAVMLVIGIMINLTRNGIKFKNNKNVIWILIALISTFSTTGYVTVAVLYSYFYLKGKLSFLNILKIFLVIVPLCIAIYNIEFVGEKIIDHADLETRMIKWDLSYSYAQKQGVREYEYLGSLDRFEALYWNFENFKHDPLLGYGRNFNNSFFRQNITSNFFLAGGLIQEFSTFGFFIGLLLWIILYKSSISFSENNKTSKPFALLICFAACNFSYYMFFTPIYTAMWFYSLFKED